MGGGGGRNLITGGNVYVTVSISIIPEYLESSRRDLAFGSVKTRFKAILKK